MTITAFKVDVTNHIKPWTEGTVFVPSRQPTIEATFTVEDPATYQALLGSAPTFTIKMDADLNPNRRWARTFRQFGRQLADIVRWEWRNAVYGPPAETCSITLPNVRAENITIAGP